MSWPDSVALHTSRWFSRKLLLPKKWVFLASMSCRSLENVECGLPPANDRSRVYMDTQQPCLGPWELPPPLSILCPLIAPAYACAMIQLHSGCMRLIKHALSDVNNLQESGHVHLQSDGSRETPAAALRSETSGSGPGPSKGMLLAGKPMLLLLGAAKAALPGRGVPLPVAAWLPLLVMSLNAPLENMECGC